MYVQPCFSGYTNPSIVKLNEIEAIDVLPLICFPALKGIGMGAPMILLKTRLSHF